MSRRWRPVALRQVTGLQIITIVAVWIFGVILGFGLVYFGQMSRTSFSAASTGDPLDFFGAMYFSAAQLATVGGSYLTAETDVLRFLSIAESLTGVILVSLILAFLLGVYGVISDLSALCTRFFSAERGAGSPVASLKPYFRDGQPNGLDGHLDAVAGTFASYTDGLRLHHAAYYFQSGRDRFALPYAVRMLGGTLGALRWGLPSTHPATSQPGLVPLTFQFLEFGEYLERTARWQSAAVPEVVGAEEFARLVADPHQRDEWVARFVELDRDMAALAGVTPLADLDEAYRRYTRWLPFAHRAQQITLAVSRDLDYQPIIVSDAPVSILRADDDLALQSLASELPVPTPPSGEPDQEARGRLSRWRMFADRHLSLVDPGHARLRTAVRAVVAAVAAVASLHLVFDLLGESPVPPAFFGGFVAMLSTGVSVDKTVRGRKVTSLLVVVPVALVVLLGALVGGIESQLTAVWSLTYSTRRLVHAVEQAVEAGVEPGSEDWAGLRRATGENLSALTVALAGQLHGHVHDDLVLDVEEGAADRLARPEDAVLHQLEWINQTVLLLLATISPGAVRTAGSPDTARTP